MPSSEKIRICLRAGLVIWLGTLMAITGMAQATLSASLKKPDHCSLMQGNPYDETVGCLVWDRRAFGDSEARQIEIYRKGERLVTIEPGDPIREWHFWERGRRMSVAYGAPGASTRFALYDLATGKQVDAAVAASALPQWAKNQSQLEDESVPEGDEYKEQRTLWVGKVLRGLDGLKVGMRRKDLASLLSEEGGISTRSERTYVSVACPYIKIDLKFKPVGDAGPLGVSGEDVVVEISKPYLSWSVID